MWGLLLWHTGDTQWVDVRVLPQGEECFSNLELTCSCQQPVIP